jgi:DNA-binding transcriptional regulator YiaG
MTQIIVTPDISVPLPARLLAAIGWQPGAPLVADLDGHGGLVLRVLPTIPRPASAATPAETPAAHPAAHPAASPGAPPDAELLGARLHLGLTRSELATLLGVAPTDVAAWEEGRSEPTNAHRAAARALLADPGAVRQSLDEPGG